MGVIGAGMGLMFALIGQFAQGNRQQRPHPKIKIQEKPDFSCGVDATERSCRMSLPKEFWEKLPEKSDAHLYEMLVHKDPNGNKNWRRSPKSKRPGRIPKPMNP